MMKVKLPVPFTAAGALMAAGAFVTLLAEIPAARPTRPLIAPVRVQWKVPLPLTPL
jgi:hypothetical protein